jgi:hypothetical protein
MSENTIFVLGAGFSAPAHLPLQAELMRGVMKRTSPQPFQLDARDTLKRMFDALDSTELKTVSLEDVFTMLDRARKTGETIRGFSHQDIQDSYKSLVQTIVQEFRRPLTDMDFTSSPFPAFVDELIKKRHGNGSNDDQESDEFSIVSLNWDTILDHLLNTRGTTGDRKVVLDYGCYDYDLNNQPDHIPSIRRKGEGLFNIKLLKLHGSLNWVVCSCCGRLFSDNDDAQPPVAPLTPTPTCRFCSDVELENVVITPTLMKELAQNQLRNIWHNAFLVLQDCDRIVFVGYSFPMADFEFRYILLKSILGKQSLKIRVVLFPSDPCDGQALWRRDEVQQRYSQFFGSNRDIKFKFLDSAQFMCDPDLLWNW